METLTKAILFGIITALAAYVARKSMAVYHDGLRPSIPEIAAGRLNRKDARNYTRNISTGFIVAFAAPFSAISGVMVSHIVFLIADWIGVGFEEVYIVLFTGFVTGASASLAVSAVTWVFAHLPFPVLTNFQLIAQPVLYMLPIMPIIAIHAATRSKKFTFTAAAVIALVTVLWPFKPWLDSQTVGFIIGSLMLLVWVFSEPQKTIHEAIPELVDHASVIRRGLFPLILIGISLGVAGSLFWIAGEPAAAMLLMLHHPFAAAAIGIFSWIGFLPMVTYSSLSSSSYTSAGIPDGVPALGYLGGIPVIGGILGGALMGIEVTQLKTFEHMLRKYPRFHSAGSGIREGMTLVLDLSLLIGGAMCANQMWPGIGLLLVGILWLLNEAYGVRLMRLAVGPIAAICTGLLMNLYMFLQ